MEERFTVTVRPDTGHWWINDLDKFVMERVYHEFTSMEATELCLATEGWERVGTPYPRMIPRCFMFRVRRMGRAITSRSCSRTRRRPKGG